MATSTFIVVGVKTKSFHFFVVLQSLVLGSANVSNNVIIKLSVPCRALGEDWQT